MKIEVFPYNPKWKQLYNSESGLIKKACGDKILTIEHAGSTSVEELASKPVVDIWIGTKTLADANNMIKDMEGLGYEYVTKFENELPFRRYFRKDVNGKRAYQVHTTPASHPFRRDDLIFKDYISINEAARKDYESLKLELSKREWNDSLDYNGAKTEFITKIKKLALDYFSKLYEETESEVTYCMHKYATPQARDKAKFKMLRENGLTAIRTDIFPGFSLNRALGIINLNEVLLDKLEEFFNGKPGKFALQIPPFELDDYKKELLNKRGYNYANSWVTFCRDSSPVESRGTDLEIKEIGKEHSAVFGKTL